MRLVRMPRLGQDMKQGTLVEWLKPLGHRVEEGELLAVIETEKAEVAFESPAAGYLVAVLLTPGTAVATGEAIAWIADDPAAQPPAAESGTSGRSDAAPAPPADRRAPAAREDKPRPAPVRPGRKPVSPLARRRAKELGVDLAEVEGTGPRGRVTEADVEAANAGGQTGPGEEGHLSRMRLAIAKRMMKSVAIPQFQLVREIVLEAGHRPSDRKVSYTDLMLWATAQALRETPALNASWVDSNPPTIRAHGRIDLGFAVAVDDGLLVPVIRQADSLSLRQVSARRRRLHQAARRGNLRPGDVEGATFTVSNLGSAGVDAFSALINPPEAGILAIGSVRARPMVIDGALGVAPTVTLTLTGDHRVFDGMMGARFLEAMNTHLQSPPVP